LDGLCKYRADFACLIRVENDDEPPYEVTVYADVKGAETDLFRLKRKIFDRLNLGNPLRVVKEVGNSGTRWSTSP
jgi:hypothetical protein